MKKRVVQLAALMLTTMCLFGGEASAQRRRTTRRPSAKHMRFAPLTAEQKAVVADILEKANALEVTYNYRPEKYADDAFDVSSKSGDTQAALPEGTMKYLLLEALPQKSFLPQKSATCLKSRPHKINILHIYR